MSPSAVATARSATRWLWAAVAASRYFRAARQRRHGAVRDL